MVAALRTTLSRRQPPRFAAVWLATAVLFAISPALASGSVSSSALLSMFPFAAILAIAGIGQTLVVQQRGLDLSVPGMITLTTIIVTKYPAGDNGRLPVAIAIALAACAGFGLISGMAVTRFQVTPLVATLGVNALLLGTVYQLTSGSSTASAPSDLARFALGKTAGIPNAVIVAVIIVAVVALIVRGTVIGRRFVAVGTSAPAAHAAGIRVRAYQLSTYVIAGLAYAVAGTFLAGFLNTPGISAGNDYLLPSIAAVVLGGTSLAGGAGSVVATAIGALFLTQLDQVVLGMGAPASVQFVIQGAIIAVSMAVRNVPWRRIGPLSPGRRRLDVPHTGEEARSSPDPQHRYTTLGPTPEVPNPRL
jgi:ribose transport system permease protein